MINFQNQSSLKNFKNIELNNNQDNINVPRKHKPDYLIILFMGLLMMLGLIVIYAIGPQRANVLNNLQGSDFTSTYFFSKQTLSILLALFAFGLTAVISFKFFRKFASTFLIIGFISCLLLVISSLLNLPIAQESLGATRWFNLGYFGSLQPSEILKFGMLLYLASFLSIRARQGELNDINKTIIPISILTFLSMIFIVGIQKDMGTGLSLLAIIVSIFLAAGLGWKLIFSGFVSILLLIVLMIVLAPHRIERITTYLKGDETNLSDDSSYHIVRAKIALGSGGLIGVGIGNSVQATGYLPEAINDSVFAILGETFGFVGLVTIIILFGILLSRILKVAENLTDLNLKLIVVGVYGWLGSHIVLNIAAMIGIFPLTGITLPLLSFGGSSMIFIAAILGLTFQLSKYTSLSDIIDYRRKNEDINGRRRLGGTRYSSSGSN